MKRLPLFVILSLVVVSMTIVATYLIVREFHHQTSTALDRREAVATLGASLIHEKFDGIIDVGVSIASRAIVYQNIENGNWDGAMKTLEDLLQTFPNFDNMLFFDKEGILKASAVPAPGMIGKSFAHRGYYKGVSKEWKPYVSEAFKRAVEPKYNVVSIAVPIKSPDQKILGILLLSIKLDTIVSWSDELDAGLGASVHVLDKKGQMVSHSHMNPKDSLANFSSVATVQKLLKGERGVEVVFDPIEKEENVTAYSPVQDYGFGVEIVQPTRIAFAERRSQLIEFVLFWTLIIIGATGFLYRILKDRVVLKAQRDRERAMLESIGDGIVAIDRDWKITLWNKAATAITGWSEEEALGKPFREIVKFIRERDRKENIAFIEDAIVMSRPSFLEDGALLIKKDGSEISVGDSAAPIVGLNGETEGAIVVFRDTTRERESTHLRSDFMYATHQLRTPVTEALWNLETGMDEQDADKRNEDLRVAHQSLLSVKKLSEHLVSVSEIDQGNVVARSAPVKLIDVLTDVQNKLDKETKARGIELSIAPVSPLAAITTDQKLLQSALFEIVENAVMYSRRDAKVIVTATLKEKEFFIEVVDTGVGIPEQEQAIIFTKFFRGSNRGKENVGDGLGLYLAKAYIMLLGGKVWFESVEGSGTTFFVSLPIA